MLRLLKQGLLGFLGLIIAAGIYFIFSPNKLNSVSWDAPTNLGYVGPFIPNMALANLNSLSIGEHHGPEDVTGRQENGQWRIYTSTQSGDIIKIDPKTNTHSVFANTGGIPLGLDFDSKNNLIVADALKGLLSISLDGMVEVLTQKADDQSPIVYADELAIAQNGKIYFSDASTKFGASDFGGTLEASKLELMEHGRTGRILVFDPADQSTKVLKNNLSFPNGIAMCPKDECLLFAETGTYSIQRIWLDGIKAGLVETILSNLPGFPDNINKGLEGRYWVGLASPRSEIIDKYSNKPKIRNMIMKLPKFLRPDAKHYGLVFAMDYHGNILAQYHDPSASYSLTTGATELGDGFLYISSLGANWLGRKDLRREIIKK